MASQYMTGEHWIIIQFSSLNFISQHFSKLSQKLPSRKVSIEVYSVFSVIQSLENTPKAMRIHGYKVLFFCSLQSKVDLSL